MRIIEKLFVRRAISLFLTYAIICSTTLTLLPCDAFGQAAGAAPPQLDAATLDNVVARIALYPVPLLAQVLAASSFSDQVPDAYKWSEAHSTVKGDDLVQAMEKAQLPYDPSVQALIPFPTVLKVMNDDTTWCATLGGAVLTQRGDVMDAVQRMRKRAHDVGNLKTTSQSIPQVIEIQPANPQVVCVGAVGVLQLMPATGEQMKVGDIHQQEANIHAGVKYIRFMVDKYFANEPMDDTNKILFAFASYNAGPGRIHSLREEAGKKGLNSNVWIDNVELVAANRIGMETVTYVANIYKYYIAYKLIAEQEEERKKAKERLENGP